MKFVLLFVTLYNSAFLNQSDEDIEAGDRDQQVQSGEDANSGLQKTKNDQEFHPSESNYTELSYIAENSIIVTRKKSYTYVCINHSGSMQPTVFSMLKAYAEQNFESFIPFLDEKRVYTFVRFVANKEKNTNDFFKNSEIISTVVLTETTSGIDLIADAYKIGELVVKQYTILLEDQDTSKTAVLLLKTILYIFNAEIVVGTDTYFAFDADMTCTDIIFLEIYFKFTNNYMNRETFSYDLEVIKKLFPNLDCKYESFEPSMDNLDMEQTISLIN